MHCRPATPLVHSHTAGLLFVGDEATNGVRAQDYVAELTGLEDHSAFVKNGAEQNVLKVCGCTFL